MLYSFKGVAHSIKALHEFIEHLVLNVWCNPRGDFTIKKLHPDFQPIVEAVSKNKNDYLLKPIKHIYNICKSLSSPSLKELAKIFKSNNCIEELCNCRKVAFDYSCIEKINKQLATNIKNFCSILYTEILSKNAEYSNRYGTLREYYDVLLEAIKPKEICPFCGLIRLKSKKRTGRDAFDHYFPKGHYPFVSINIRNLFPTCDDCNSYCKKRKKPTIKVAIVSLDTDFSKNKLLLEFPHTTHKQQVDTWRDLYNIDERYNDELCSSDAKDWLERVKLNKASGKVNKAKDYIESLKRTPLCNKNFLRVPFLETCLKEGIIS